MRSRLIAAPLLLIALMFAGCGNPGAALQGQWHDPDGLIDLSFNKDSIDMMGGHIAVSYKRDGNRVIVTPDGQPAGMIFEVKDRDTLRWNNGLITTVLKRR